MKNLTFHNGKWRSLTHYRPQRSRLATEKFILEDFNSVLSQFIKRQPSGNLQFSNLGIFQCLKLLILAEKSFQFLLTFSLQILWAVMG